MSDRGKVLYVDDNDGLRLLARKVLERRGYAVTLAETGEEGLEACRRERFDLIALDHYMPGQGGFATLQAIVALPDPPPVVYVTGSEETRVAVSALKAGAVDYVVKTPGEDFFDLLQSAFEQAMEQVRLRREKLEAEEALRSSNLRLEALLREVNHRVANSLQMVSAFVQLQAQQLTETSARAALKDTQRRIEAIGQVHKRLYTSDEVDTVDMRDYLGSLIAELQDTADAACTLSLEVDEIRLQTDRAVSVGVIVNELVTNACKYAYPAACPGEVRIRFGRADNGGMLLAVEDDGRGMGSANSPKGTGLGSRLIKAMASSLNSKVTYDTGWQGVRAVLAIPA